jgi:hypothetical protein
MPCPTGQNSLRLLRLAVPELQNVSPNHEHLDIYRVRLIAPTSFFSAFKIVTIGFNQLPESLHSIEKSCMQGPLPAASMVNKSSYAVSNDRPLR